MATHNTLTRKSSFEEFYVADIVDSSKSSASKFLSMQFEKMRENLATAGINPQTSSAPSSTTKGVKFNATYNMFGTPVQTPARSNPATSSPGFTVPKPILVTSPLGKIYSRPSSPARSRLPSAEKVKVSTPQNNKTPSPPAKNMGVNPVVNLPDRPEIIRTLGSPKTSFREEDGSIAAVNTFRGLKKVNSGNFQDEVHLHHDVFLATKNDAIAQAVEAISRRRQEVVSRYPQTSGIDYTIRPETKNVQCTVPSHVVTRKGSARSQSAPRGSAGMGSRSNSSVRGGIAYSANSNQSSAHSLAGANIKVPALQLTPDAVAAGQPRTPMNTTNTTTNTNNTNTYATLTAKNLALNPAMYRPASAPSTGAKNINNDSTNSMSNLRISPTTVIDAGEQPKNASPTIKQQRKKFDFNGQGLESPPKPVNVVSSGGGGGGGSVANGSGGMKGVKEGGFVTPARTTSATMLTNTPNTSVKGTPATNSTTTSAKYTPSKSGTKADTTTKTTPNTNTTTPTTHTTHTPNKASPSTPSTTSNNTTSTSKHYRTLTAAEVSAAKALNDKLNAANLAYNRAETANIQPVRTMSRALSQLVYNVRDN